jgi:cytoplasmic iron level regulating protein YaaA (DUF328/UPF0246 family)
VLVLLPPSETKTSGGDGGPLDLDELSFPDLNPARRKLADALVSLAGDVPASLDALGLSERQEYEVARNAELWEAPTLPALARYTGVLFDTLDVASMRAAEFDRATRRLAVGSALFGIVRGGDAIPAYRLSAGSPVPGIGGLRRFWRPVLEPALSELDSLVLDMRSGAYASLAGVPGAVTVRVVSQGKGGKRTAVSHHNKAHKGRLARALATPEREPRTVADVCDVAGEAGLLVEQTAQGSLELVV